MWFYRDTFSAFSFPIDHTSSLSLLSTLAQSQAAIFAVAIGINSIVFQMISTKYSSRLSYIFTNNSRYLWLLGAASIFLDLLLIIFLPDTLGAASSFLVIISLLVAIFLCLYMTKHVYWTISLLNSAKVLDQIKTSNCKDKKEQIFDVLYGSVENHDIISVVKCLDALPYSCYQQSKRQSDKFNYTKCIVLELVRAGEISTKLANDAVISHTFKKIYKYLEEFPLEASSVDKNMYLIDTIINFIKYCSRIDLESSTVSGMSSLVDIIIERGILDDKMISTNLLNSIVDISLVASEKKLEILTKGSIDNIVKLADLYIIKNYYINEKILSGISSIGYYSVTQKVEQHTYTVLVTLGNLALYFYNKHFTQNNDIKINYLSSVNYILSNMLKIKALCEDNNFIRCIEEVDKLFLNFNYVQY